MLSAGHLQIEMGHAAVEGSECGRNSVRESVSPNADRSVTGADEDSLIDRCSCVVRDQYDRLRPGTVIGPAHANAFAGYINEGPAGAAAGVAPRWAVVGDQIVDGAVNTM